MNRQRILIFCATAPRLEPEVIESIFNQEGIEFFDVFFTRDNPYSSTWGEIFKNIQLNYSKVKTIAHDFNYDKVWIVESDTIPPKDALKKLLEVDSPVVTGLYPLRHGVPVPNLMRKEMSPGLGSNMNWGEISLSLGKVIEVSGGCMGCLLIDPSAMKGFEFNEKEKSPDVPLMEFFYKNGIKQMAHLGVLCGHKKPSGEILRPENYLTRKENA